jgi:hypothetical protein
MGLYMAIAYISYIYESLLGLIHMWRYGDSAYMYIELPI